LNHGWTQINTDWQILDDGIFKGRRLRLAESKPAILLTGSDLETAVKPAISLTGSGPDLVSKPAIMHTGSAGRQSLCVPFQEIIEAAVGAGRRRSGFIRIWSAGTVLSAVIRKEALDAEITALLKPFALRADWADEMLTRVKDEKKQAAQSALQVAVQKRGEIDKINARLQRLLDSFLDGIVDREEYSAEKAKLMSQKKTLEEQKARLTAGRADWLEPFKEWILTTKNAGEIAVSGSLQEKRVLALKVFGSNLVLDCKKARGSCVKPWSFLIEPSSSRLVERVKGIEPSSRYQPPCVNKTQ
jgi:hypothetical protein